jgi:hypothetical protein
MSRKFRNWLIKNVWVVNPRVMCPLLWTQTFWVRALFGGGEGGQACNSCPARPSRLMPNQASHSHQEIRETGDDLRSYSQTAYKPESQGFCFQLCTSAHFQGFLPLPWFSCFLVFSPSAEVRWGTWFT